MDIGTQQIGTDGEGADTPSPHASMDRPAAIAGEIGSVPRAAPQRPVRFRCGRGRTEWIRPRREVDPSVGGRAMLPLQWAITDLIRRLGIAFDELPHRWHRKLVAV